MYRKKKIQCLEHCLSRCTWVVRNGISGGYQTGWYKPAVICYSRRKNKLTVHTDWAGITCYVTHLRWQATTAHKTSKFQQHPHSEGSPRETRPCRPALLSPTAQCGQKNKVLIAAIHSTRQNLSRNVPIPTISSIPDTGRGNAFIALR